MLKLLNVDRSHALRGVECILSEIERPADGVAIVGCGQWGTDHV